jgi:hypothetical protein
MNVTNFFRLMDHTQFSKHVQKLESRSLVSVTMNAFLLPATAACALSKLKAPQNQYGRLNLVNRLF